VAASAAALALVAWLALRPTGDERLDAPEAVPPLPPPQGKPDPASAWDRPGSGTLRGTVQRREDGEPVAGASVEIRPAGDLTRRIDGTQSDGEGQFRIELPTSFERLFVIVKAEGFAWESIGIETRDDLVDPLVVRLTGDAMRIEGQVLGESGPLAGADVVVSCGTGARFPVQSDERGQFTVRTPISNLEVVAAAEGYAPAWASLPYDDRRHRSVTLRLDRGTTIHGRVLDGGTGEGIPGAQIRDPAWTGRVATSDGAGYYTYEGFPNTPRGLEGSLLVQARGYVPREIEVFLDGERPPATAKLDVILLAGAIVRGRVVDERQRPLGRALVRLTAADQQLASCYSTLDDGSFELLPVPAGPTPSTLQARSPDCYATSVSVTLAQPGDHDVGPIELRSIREEPVEIRGAVALNGHAARDVIVEATTGAPGGNAEVGRSVVAGDGTFSMNVPRGLPLALRARAGAAASETVLLGPLAAGMALDSVHALGLPPAPEKVRFHNDGANRVRLLYRGEGAAAWSDGGMLLEELVVALDPGLYRVIGIGSRVAAGPLLVEVPRASPDVVLPVSGELPRLRVVVEDSRGAPVSAVRLRSAIGPRWDTLSEGEHVEAGAGSVLAPPPDLGLDVAIEVTSTDGETLGAFRKATSQPTVRLVLAPRTDATVVVLAASGKPVALATVHVRDALGRTVLGLRPPPAPDDPDLGMVERYDETGIEGRVEFPGLLPGDYEVEVTHPSYRTSRVTLQLPGPSTVRVQMAD